MKRHTDHDYETELGQLRELVLRMGATVEGMMHASVQALVDRDTAVAQRTLAEDHQVNRLEVDIDELCLRILARRQPVASDLRFLTTTLKLVTDLERIGDMVVNICERVVELNEEAPLPPHRSVQRMAEGAESLVRQALDAFVQRDAERAQHVLTLDRNIDDDYIRIFRELLTYMMEDPRNIYRATRLQSIAKYLERIGDHATNIAELVVFMVKGRDIRHPASRTT